MNIFILNTGRCASTTWVKACQHITNYAAGHETQAHIVGDQRMVYPNNHIEADNRLSWFLGRLDQGYGNSAFYVHLSRERTATINSFSQRHDFGIMHAYHHGILLHANENAPPQAIAADYIETVESNIRHFLKDKPLQMSAHLETIQDDFKQFWQSIDAKGDLDQALAEFDVRYNATKDELRDLKEINPASR